LPYTPPLLCVSEADKWLWQAPQDFHLSHSDGQNRVMRVYHYPDIQVMAKRSFHKSLPDHCMNRSLFQGHGVQFPLARCISNVFICFIQLSKNTRLYLPVY